MKSFLKMNVFCAVFLSSYVVASPLDRLVETLADGVPSHPSSKVAVLSFPYHDGKISSGSSIVQERLTTLLAASGRMDIIERSLLEKVLAEKKLEIVGVLDPATTQEVGKILGADALVTGTLIELPNKKTEINARLIDAKTGKVLAAAPSTIETVWNDSPHFPRDTTVVGPVLPTPPIFRRQPRIQVALLLDTSNSMDGLIQQAKTQLWKIANQLASAERFGNRPVLEVALYEYGNDRLSAGENYVRQVLPFTTDLDRVSEKLFALTTMGGQEYCGAVIRDSLAQLDWSSDDSVYKVIFVAGNEPFTQGPVPFQESLASARRKGVIVNTIFCGDRQEGIQTGWSDGAQLARGDYMVIDQNAAVVAVATPYDREIERLGRDLSQTYIAKGQLGGEAKSRQMEQDALAEQASVAGASVERSLYKAASPQYQQNAASWDLVSAIKTKSVRVEELKKEDLPAELRGRGTAEITQYVKQQDEKRQSIEKQIQTLNEKRVAFLAAKEKETVGSSTQSLDKAMLSAIRAQAVQKNFRFTAGTK